jgi:hypothetical protein
VAHEVVNDPVIHGNQTPETFGERGHQELASPHPSCQTLGREQGRRDGRSSSRGSAFVGHGPVPRWRSRNVLRTGANPPAGAETGTVSCRHGKSSKLMNCGVRRRNNLIGSDLRWASLRAPDTFHRPELAIPGNHNPPVGSSNLPPATTEVFMAQSVTTCAVSCFTSFRGS